MPFLQSFCKNFLNKIVPKPFLLKFFFIKNDIINALLVDIKIEKKSSINQNFINSF